jgi:hypothetical protein
MSAIRVSPRSAINDAELARMATVDLPMAPFHITSPLRRPRTPKAVIAAIGALAAHAAFDRPVEPDRVIVMTLSPVPARNRG